MKANFVEKKTQLIFDLPLNALFKACGLSNKKYRLLKVEVYDLYTADASAVRAYFTVCKKKRVKS